MRTNRTYSVETTILGGLPVTVDFSVSPPDRSVGYDGEIEDVEFRSAKNGKPLGQWVERRLDETNGWDNLHERLWELAREQDDSR